MTQTYEMAISKETDKIIADARVGPKNKHVDDRIRKWEARAARIAAELQLKPRGYYVDVPLVGPDGTALLNPEGTPVVYVISCRLMGFEQIRFSIGKWRCDALGVTRITKCFEYDYYLEWKEWKNGWLDRLCDAQVPLAVEHARKALTLAKEGKLEFHAFT